MKADRGDDQGRVSRTAGARRDRSRRDVNDANCRCVDTARKFGAELIVLYVFDPAAYEELLGETWMPLDEYTGHLRMELRDQVEVEAAGAEMRTCVEVVDGHNVALEILSDAARFEADLIVTGTHARTGLRRAVHGSVAQEVLRHARTMVLLTPLSVLEARRQLALAAS